MSVISEQPTDEDLVAALNAGQSQAFDALYERYRDWVLRMAWRLTGHHEDALDVLQETFAYLARKFPGFTLTAAMTSFLYPAVRNLSIAARRKRHRSVGSSDGLDAVPDHRTNPDTNRAEFTAILSGLSDDHREILLLRFVDNLTQPEIATHLNLPLGTVKSRLYHAVRAVRESPAVGRLSGTAMS